MTNDDDEISNKDSSRATSSLPPRRSSSPPQSNSSKIGPCLFRPPEERFLPRDGSPPEANTRIVRLGEGQKGNSR